MLYGWLGITQPQPTMKAIWNNQVIAESDETIVVELNHHFPPSAIKSEYFKPSDKHTARPW